jgi:hypothetical protein
MPLQTLATLKTLNESEVSGMEQEKLFSLLGARARVLDELYKKGPRYARMVDETIEELRSYTGPDPVQNLVKFNALLIRKGWAITPKLWSRAELTCIGILALDPTLPYDSIIQKDREGEASGIGFSLGFRLGYT